MHTHYSPKDDDYSPVKGKDGLKAVPVMQGENGSFRGGFAVRRPGFKSERIVWFDEFYICLSGTLKISISDPGAYDKDDTFSIEAGDVAFWGRGCRVRTEATGSEPVRVFYLEVPSGEYGTHHTVAHPKQG